MLTLMYYNVINRLIEKRNYTKKEVDIQQGKNKKKFHMGGPEPARAYAI